MLQTRGENGEKMDKKLQAYYTNSDCITNYMVNNLELEDNELILEPGCGEGAFVDKILSTGKNVSIDIYDIDDHAIKVITKKYENQGNIKIYKSDTLLDKRLDLPSCKGYTKIIGNPPYGAYLDIDMRKSLRKKYPEIYIKDTYVIFLYRCLKLLRPNGKLAFIVPDSFLYLNMYKNFRQYLFGNFCIEEIAIFPSKLFPGISFAYSNLCIVTIKNDKSKITKNNMHIYDHINRETQFNDIVNKRLNPKSISQKSILGNFDYNFHLNKNIENIIQQAKVTLGDLADCVTGIYTGNNKKFIKVLSHKIRNSKDYQVIDHEKIN